MDLVVPLVDVWAAQVPDKPGGLALVLDALQNITHTLHSVQVLGPNRPGIAAEIAQQVAEAGINLRGFSASAVGE